MSRPNTKRPKRLVCIALIVGLWSVFISVGPSSVGLAQANELQTELRVCALRWGMNHDLGYCGQIVAQDQELRSVKLDRVFVSNFGFGWKNACSAWLHLGQLKPGATITVHKDCLDRKPGLLSNWRDTTVLIQGVAGVALLLLGA